MYSEHSTYSNYINVSYRLANRYCNDKFAWDLLCLAICLKLNRNDSGMYLRDPRDIMRLFHCSYRKAKRLMDGAISAKYLFRYNPKTKFLVAKSFKRGCKVKNSQSGKRFYQDDCIAIEKSEYGTISHYEISIQLRDSLMQKAIRIQASSDELRCHNNLHSEMQKPLTQEYIGNIAGCHQTTVSRHLNKMAKQKKLSILSHEKIPVVDLEHGIVLNDFENRKPFISGRFMYIRDVNEYTILDNKIHFKFKHIIYNHKRRLTDNRKIRMPYEL